MTREDEEFLIDDIAASYGLREVLETLATWCNEEAHEALCGGDESGYLCWRKDVKCLEKAAKKVHV